MMCAEIADMVERLVTGELSAAIVGAYIDAAPEVQRAIKAELEKLKNPCISICEALDVSTRIQDMLVEASGGVTTKKPPQDVRIVETDKRTVFVYIDGKLAWEDSIIDTDRLIARLDNVRLYSMEVTSREHDCLNRNFPPQDISAIEDRLDETIADEYDEDEAHEND